MSDFTRGLPELGNSARRPLPEDDATIEALPHDVRARIAEGWVKRSEAEFSAGAVFASITRGLFFEDVPREVLWLAARAVTDEIRHGELCLFAANRYSGIVHQRPKALVSNEARGGALIHAVVNGAINETIATAFLNASFEAATSPFARAILRELLADEVDHARVGWAVLADGSPKGAEIRAETEKHLSALVDMVRTIWIDSARAAPNDLPREHGCIPGRDVMKIVDEALVEIVFPGFAHVGIDPSPLSRLLG